MFDISRLEGKHRALTQQHIDQGIAKDCSYCPVAMVLSEMVNDQVLVEVDGSDSIELFSKHHSHNLIGKLLVSGVLGNWIWRFDRNKPVKPGVLFIFRQEDEDEESDWLWVGFSKGSPLTYHPTPEEMTAHIVFKDGSTATWQAHGGEGRIDCLQDDTGGTYYTDEALKTLGVRTFTLENMHEVEVD